MLIGLQGCKYAELVKIQFSPVFSGPIDIKDDARRIDAGKFFFFHFLVIIYISFNLFIAGDLSHIKYKTFYCRRRKTHNNAMSAGTYLGLCLSLLVVRVSLGSAGKAEQVLNAAVL